MGGGGGSTLRFIRWSALQLRHRLRFPNSFPPTILTKNRSRVYRPRIKKDYTLIRSDYFLCCRLNTYAADVLSIYLENAMLKA